MTKDTYRTIAKPSTEILYKDRNSKFFGYAFPVSSEMEVKDHLESLKKEHYNAGHFCYAYQIGTTEAAQIYRANDDGEPNNSAGMPIYGQIQSFELTDILIVIVRYFGGTKLGVGGLIQAYKSAAEMTLQQSKIVKRIIKVTFELVFDYPAMNEVMRIIKIENLKIVDQVLEMSCKIIIAVRLRDEDKIFELYKAHPKIEIKKLND